MARAAVLDSTRRPNLIRDAVLFSNLIPFLLLVKHISNAHFVKDIYLYENYLYILIQLKGGPSFCFQCTFSIKNGITCLFGPFTTFKHYNIISRFQYQNIYKTKSDFVQKCQIYFMNARSELYFKSVRP